MKKLPCVVFAFNRPRKLNRVLKSLKNQHLDQLILFVDGPRNNKDERLVEKCRIIGQKIDWVKTELHYWPENRGLFGLPDNIRLVLEKYPWAVFVEDDCLPMPGFYELMRQALVRYETEKQVFSIGGYQYINPEYFDDYPYSFISTLRFTCWGWATWSDRWTSIQPLVDRYDQLFDNLKNIPDVVGQDVPKVARAMASGGAEESWAVKVGLATLDLKMVHLLPTRGVIRNIGQDRRGVHVGLMTFVRSLFFQNRNVTSKIPSEKIHWLEDVTPDCDYMDAIIQFVNQAQSFNLRRLIDRGRVLVRRHIWPRMERLYNINLENIPDQLLNRKALLSYITHPFYIPREDTRFLRHINIWHAQEIVRVLNRMGYKVDIIDYRDESFHPQEPYDLFIGHGGLNFKTIVTQLQGITKKIYFSTGSYWQYHNKEEEDQFDALLQRRGVGLAHDRYINQGEDDAIQLADGVIGIGNENTQDTYQHSLPVIMINGTSLSDDHFDWCQKDYLKGREHFVFFASGGNVHKGLDLLLEAFSHIEQHLWVCSPIDSGFKNIYSKELYACGNIHTIG